MFSRTTMFQEFLSQNNYIDELYDAMGKDDKSELVMRALSILRKTGSLPMYNNNYKNEIESSVHRTAGNNAYHSGFHEKALALYNLALLKAPKNSRALKLAYGNRSALFSKLQQWIPCNNDINRCLSLGCPDDIYNKLIVRQSQALKRLAQEGHTTYIFKEAGKECVYRSSLRHSNVIPCASTHVKIDTSSAKHKVIASANIQVGDVVATEKAYVSLTTLGNNRLVSCHFCQKKTLDLIPCDGCNFALFCDEECKTKCMEEYHEYECKIMDAIVQLCFGTESVLMIKACLKLKTSCKSWKELIAASNNLGMARMKSSSLREIYNRDDKYSILCLNEDKTFIHGIMYNACFVCAALLHYLDVLIPSFLPKDRVQKQQAMRALAKIMMFLSVYQKPLHIIQGQNNISIDVSSYGMENFGLFSFIGKVKYSCNSNLVIAANNNKLILIAIRPIVTGEELTVRYIWHCPSNEIHPLHSVRSFLYQGTVCGCHECNKNNQVKNNELSENQKDYLTQLDLNYIKSKLTPMQMPKVYSVLLRTLSVLKDVPSSKEYIDIYICFRKCVFIFEVFCGDNSVLDGTF